MCDVFLPEQPQNHRIMLVKFTINVSENVRFCLCIIFYCKIIILKLKKFMCYQKHFIEFVF